MWKQPKWKNHSSSSPQSDSLPSVLPFCRGEPTVRHGIGINDDGGWLHADVNDDAWTVLISPQLQLRSSQGQCCICRWSTCKFVSRTASLKPCVGGLYLISLFYFTPSVSSTSPKQCQAILRARKCSREFTHPFAGICSSECEVVMLTK